VGLPEELIATYAEQGPGGEALSDRLRALAERYKGDSAFDATLNLVSEQAEMLEEGLAGKTHREQVSVALEVFFGARENEEAQVACRVLTRGRFFRYWSPSQRDYYEDAAAKLESCDDYFLSFTNHNPSEDEAMFVNTEHKTLIRAGLDRPVGMAEARQQNMLAKMLDYILTNIPLKGFFYLKERGADDVEEMIKTRAEESLVFVQVVQNAMFGKTPNYCHEEFKAASAAERKLIFVMSVPFKEFIDARLVVNSMRTWHSAIRCPDIVDLEPTKEPGRARELLAEIRQRVVKPVEEARMKLFENVPT
jgi:hypothetical protein